MVGKWVKVKDYIIKQYNWPKYVKVEAVPDQTIFVYRMDFKFLVRKSKHIPLIKDNHGGQGFYGYPDSSLFEACPITPSSEWFE